MSDRLGILLLVGFGLALYLRSHEPKGAAPAVAPPRAPPRGPAGARLSFSQIRDIAHQAGFPDPDIAAAVALAESSGIPTRVHDTRGIPQEQLPKGTTNEWSVGLWQINLLAHKAFQGWDLTDPIQNARAALIVRASPRGWKNWSTFNMGSKPGGYLNYLPAGSAAA